MLSDPQAPTAPRRAEGVIPKGSMLLAGLLSVVGIGLCLLGDASAYERYLPDLFIGAASSLYLAFVFSPIRGPISMLTGFFFLFFLAIPAKIQIDSSNFPFGGNYTTEELTSAFLICFISIAALIVGSIASKEPTSVAAGIEARTKNEMTDDIAAVGVIGIWICILVNLVVVALVGPGALTTLRFERDSLNSSDLQSQLTLVGRSLSLFGLLLAIYLLRNRDVRRTPGFQLGFFLSVLLAAVINFPPALPRFQLLGAAIAIATVVAPMYRVRTKIAFSVAAPAFLFYGFAALKSLGRSDASGTSASVPVREYLQRVDFDAFKQIADTQLYLQENALRGPDTWIGCLFFWVPRSLWPGKPVHSGEVVSQALGYNYNNVSSPLPAEGLLTAGVLGAVIIMYSLGRAIRAIEQPTVGVRRTGTAPRQLLACALGAGFIVIILRGALLAVFPMLGTAFIAYLLYARAARSVDPKAITSPAREGVRQ